MTDEERLEEQLSAVRLFCASFKSKKSLLAIRQVVDEVIGYRESIEYFKEHGIAIEGRAK